MELHKIVKIGDIINRRKMSSYTTIDDLEYQVDDIVTNELGETMVWLTRPGWSERIFYFSWQLDTLFKVKSLTKLLKKL